MPDPVRTILLYLFSCGPAVLTFAAWLKLYLARQQNRPDLLSTVALAVTTAIAIYSATVSIYYAFGASTASLPPWKDPYVLDMGMLFLLAPIGCVLGLVVAGKRAGPAWLIAVIEIASLPLFLLGIMAGFAV